MKQSVGYGLKVATECTFHFLDRYVSLFAYCTANYVLYIIHIINWDMRIDRKKIPAYPKR